MIPDLLRYDLDYGFTSCYMEESPEGDWVEYDAVIKIIDSLLREIESLSKMMQHE